MGRYLWINLYLPVLCGLVSPCFNGVLSSVSWTRQQFGKGPVQERVKAPSLGARITWCEGMLNWAALSMLT